MCKKFKQLYYSWSRSRTKNKSHKTKGVRGKIGGILGILMVSGLRNMMIADSHFQFRERVKMASLSWKVAVSAVSFICPE